MQQSRRRHESLIPLSREHQYALLMCLRIRQDVAKPPTDADRLRQRAAAVVQFFDEELTLHFKAEEELLFPAMRGWPEAARLIGELQQEHRELESLIEGLRRTSAASLADRLAQFAQLLEAHIRKEERALFPIFEQQASAELSRRLGQEIVETIGLALQPKHPELLR
jgi:iron-sulfur cluster repair protein YtfE (RIC family)